MKHQKIVGRITECGVKFEHDAHLNRTQRGKIKACDGVFLCRKVTS